MYDALTEKWFPELTSCDSVYDKGWFKYKGGAMFITSGIGDYPYPVRFCNRPEIVPLPEAIIFLPTFCSFSITRTLADGFAIFAETDAVSPEAPPP